MPFNTQQKHIIISTSTDIDVYTSGNPSILLDETRSLLNGGWIEIVQLDHLLIDTNVLDEAVVVVDEDGLNKGLSINHIAMFLTGQYIVGNVILTKDVAGELVGFNPEECEQVEEYLKGVIPSIKQMIQ